MRKLITIITEFEKPATGGFDLPPVADMERDDGGNSEGSFWVGPNGKVVIEKNQYGGSDHAQSVYLNPEAFGLTWEEVLHDVKMMGGDEPVTWLQRWKVNQDNGTHASEYSAKSPDSTLGGRIRGQNILYLRGWTMVDYQPPERISIYGSKAGITKDIESVMEHFPMMKCDSIAVTLYDTSVNDWRVGGSAIFHKEDYPGITGHINAMVAWLHGDQAPLAHFLYFKKGAEVKEGYLVLSRPGMRGYYVPYVGEQEGRFVQDRNAYFRIPSTAIPAGLKSDFSKAYGMILYSDKPFELPKGQTWNGRHWN